MLKFGIVGIGNMGTAHLKRLMEGKIPGAAVSAAADIKKDRLDYVSGLYPEVRCFNTASEMIDSGLCDVILVAVPHYDHCEISMYAMDKGLHVMCEKPAGVFTKDVREMNKRADETGVCFGMMFNHRVRPINIKMRELIKSGSLGAIKRVNLIINDWYRTQSYYDSGAWRATWAGEGGGVLINQCPHNLDQLQWICGMPNLVHAYAHNGKWHDIEVEDDVSAYFEYPNGATGVFVTSTADCPGTNRFEILLDGGKIVCEDGKTLRIWRLEQNEREFCVTAKGGFDTPKYTEEVLDSFESSPEHDGILIAFVDYINGKKENIADGREGINSLTISNAMHLSAWLGKAVPIPFDEDLFLSELNKRRAVSRHKTGADVHFDTEGTY